MATWPGTLPQSPLVGSYNETVADNTIRTQMDQGPAKVRKRTTAGVVRFKMAFQMTLAQVATFQTFYDANMAELITFDHPRTGASSGNFRFASAPQYQSTGNGYRVSFEMELLP